MRNHNYANEIATANQFVIEHNTDIELMNFLKQLENPMYCHSDRWSQIYDYMNEHYPSVTGSLITGLAYWVED